MYLIIVGAGSISKQLVTVITEEGHKVAVIEKHEQRAREIMQQFDVRVFHANVAQANILEEAGIENADGIIATTKDDAVNLMAMMLGKEYQVKHLITLLQAAEYQPMFEKLGVRVLSNPEKLVAQKLFSFIN